MDRNEARLADFCFMSENEPSCNALTLNKEFEAAYWKWLGAKAVQKVNVLAVNVGDGECVIDEATKSRYD